MTIDDITGDMKGSHKPTERKTHQQVRPNGYIAQVLRYNKQIGYTQPNAQPVADESKNNQPYYQENLVTLQMQHQQLKRKKVNNSAKDTIGCKSLPHEKLF